MTTTTTTSKTKPQIYIFISTDQGDPPVVYGALGLIRRDGSIGQDPLKEIGAAGSHAQGTLMVLVDLLRRLSMSKEPVAICMADTTAVSLLCGDAQARTQASTRTIVRLLTEVRRLIEARHLKVEFRQARWHDLVAAEPDFVDAWA